MSHLSQIHVARKLFPNTLDFPIRSSYNTTFSDVHSSLPDDVMLAEIS